MRLAYYIELLPVTKVKHAKPMCWRILKIIFFRIGQKHGILKKLTGEGSWNYMALVTAKYVNLIIMQKMSQTSDDSIFALWPNLYHKYDLNCTDPV